MKTTLSIPVDKFQTDIHEALKLWNKGNSHGSPIHTLYLYQQGLLNGHSTPRQATNHVLQLGLDQLALEDEENAQILEMRFSDGLSAQEVANRLSVAQGTVFKKQAAAIVRLADLIYEEEILASAAYRQALDARLEKPTYEQLLGADEHLPTLVDLLTAEDGPILLSIEGIGGIGKTSLANGLVRHMIEQGLVGAGPIADLGWVTARQSMFNLGGAIKDVDKPALTIDALVEVLFDQLLPDMAKPVGRSLDELLPLLKEHLQARAYLIVVDNLETLADVEALLETLRELANPTRFLLTTRYGLFAEPDVYHFRVPPLSEPTTLTLVRQEAKRRNLPDLVEASDADLHPIYETVGGNPLALRLVVGQTHVHALGDVLDDLTAARGQKIENLYTYIYRRAWENLDEPTRRVFLLMPLVTEDGADMDYLAGMSQLVTLSLVDVRGGLQERRYTIHSLTRTFLQEQVLAWQVDS